MVPGHLSPSLGSRWTLPALALLWLNGLHLGPTRGTWAWGLWCWGRPSAQDSTCGSGRSHGRRGRESAPGCVLASRAALAWTRGTSPCHVAPQAPPLCACALCEDAPGAGLGPWPNPVGQVRPQGSSPPRAPHRGTRVTGCQGITWHTRFQPPTPWPRLHVPVLCTALREQLQRSPCSASTVRSASRLSPESGPGETLVSLQQGDSTQIDHVQTVAMGLRGVHIPVKDGEMVGRRDSPGGLPL